MNKILITEAAWLAGLFEGEGSVGIYNGSYRLSIGQHERSLDVLVRVQEILGCGKIYGPYATKTGAVCSYQVTNKKEVIKILKLIYPYLLSRRRDQCDLILLKE